MGGLYIETLAALYGKKAKMSSSDKVSTIFLDDSPKDVESKTMNHAFKGDEELGEN